MKKTITLCMILSLMLFAISACNANPSANTSDTTSIQNEKIYSKDGLTIDILNGWTLSDDKKSLSDPSGLGILDLSLLDDDMPSSVDMYSTIKEYNDMVIGYFEQRVPDFHLDGREKFISSSIDDGEFPYFRMSTDTDFGLYTFVYHFLFTKNTKLIGVDYRTVRIGDHTEDLEDVKQMIDTLRFD